MLKNFILEECRRLAFASALLLMVLAPTTPAWANDSEAAIAAGNLVLKKSDGIVMESEDLFLSRDLVKVRYIFQNTTPQEIRTIVAFPVARENYELDDQGRPLQDPELTRDLRFEVRVQGQPVVTQVERSVEMKKDSYLDKATYYWDQIFPAGRKIEVAHTYRPGVGGFFFSPADDHYQSVKGYCIDPPLLQTLKGIASRKQGLVPATTIHYVLSTGANWKGPIRNFRLVLDKGSPENLVSLCIEGIRKIGPTQFESVKKDFTPQQDLRIVFFEKK